MSNVSSTRIGKVLSLLIVLCIVSIASFTMSSCSKKTEPTQEEKAKVEKALAEFADQLSLMNIDSAASYNAIKEYLKKNDFVYGSAWAVEVTNELGNNISYCTYVYNKEGNQLIKVLPSFKTAEWYTGPINAKKGYWSKPYFDKEGGEINMITYSIPVFAKDSTQKLLGVITSDLPLE